ncbi:MAG: hypothetical protein EHM61_25755 [Acidobacteria bacterium]|nr:MAG: hypothetical protein EHM61_25755 [Acidobacteriota bacterium]
MDCITACRSDLVLESPDL